ncbi:MAG: hypothetical protein V1858_02785 [Candidatus Gottesmanbacteria bacterium]
MRYENNCMHPAIVYIPDLRPGSYDANGLMVGSLKHIPKEKIQKTDVSAKYRRIGPPIRIVAKGY